MVLCGCPGRNPSQVPFRTPESSKSLLISWPGKSSPKSGTHRWHDPPFCEDAWVVPWCFFPDSQSISLTSLTKKSLDMSVLLP